MPMCESPISDNTLTATFNLYIKQQSDRVPMHGDLFPRVPRMLVVKFCLVLANTLVINFVLQFPSQHYSITVAALNATACLATIYGLITIYRYGIRGAHGQPLLYLTLGILFWFIADLTLAYGHLFNTMKRNSR